MNKELFLAVKTGNASLIKELDRQVLLDVTFEGDTPLHIAAREGHLSIVKWILSEKSYMAGVKNNDKNTPLHEAAKCDNPELLEHLLDKRKISAYSYNKFGETALVIACKYGHVGTVKHLCKVKKYFQKIEMQQCLRLAGYMGYSDIVTAILDKSKVSRFYFDGSSFRFLIDLLRGLLVGNEDVARGATRSLIAAIHGGHLQTVKAVLNFDSRHKNLMTEKDEFGMCAIHVAVIKDRSDIIEEFISRWPDCVEIRSSDHKTILHIAVEYDKFAVVQSLLANKEAEKVAQLVSHDDDCFHNTALHLAAKKGVDPQLVEFLISLEGIDVNAVNNDDMTALDIASAAANDNPYSNFARIEQLLESVGGIRLSHKPNYNRNISDSDKREYKDIVNTHMVVASLIATVTFAAILTVPGGIENDKNSVHYGAAKMAFRHLFKLFLFSNTAAFTTSFTLVIAWLVRQLIRDSYFERRSILSHMSVVTLIVRQLTGDRYFERGSILSHMSGMTLIVSILWTTASFVSATIIIILPANYDDLRSTHKEAFSKYESLRVDEIVFVIFSPLYLGIPLLSLMFRILGFRRKWYLRITSIVLVALTACIIYGTLTFK